MVFADSITSENEAINHILNLLEDNTKRKIRLSLKWAEKYKLNTIGCEYNSRQIAALVFFYESVDESSSWKIGQTLCAMDTAENNALASWLCDTFYFKIEVIYDVFVALMKSGARLGHYIAYKMNTKYNIMQEAAGKGDNDLLQWLLSWKVEIDFRDLYRKTALHVAASEGQVATVKFLLDHGASMFVFDSEGRSPFISALDYSRFDICDILCPKVFENMMIESIILNVVREGNVHKLQYLLRYNKWNIIWKALEEAVELGYPDIIETLLQHCPSLLKAPEAYNKTVLSKAFIKGDLNIIEKLIVAGFQVDDLLINFAKEQKMNTIVNRLGQNITIDTVD